MKTALEIVLSQMVTEGWANESDGEVSAPTGHFAKMTNMPEEVAEIRDAFEDSCRAYTEAESDWDWDKIIGYWLIVEDEQGFTHVTEFKRVADLNAAYAERQRDYNNWIESEQDPKD